MISTFVLILFEILSFYYEHNTYAEIVGKQLQKNAIYGSALNENYFLYRLELIRQKQPTIIALGSSRAGQFRQKFFSAPFVAATNGANSIAEMDFFIEEMLKFHRPKFIILTLDPWWFNPKYPNNRKNSYQELTGIDITYNKVLGFFRFFPILLSTKHPNPKTIFETMGIRAMLTSNGSFSDGSIFYATTLVSNPKTTPSLEPEMQSGRFKKSKMIDKQRLRQLESILDKLKNNQIHYFIIVPPLAPYTMNILNQDDGYQYFKAFSNHIQQYGGISFLDSNSLNINDCEFYDAIHPGDIVYAKMLLYLSTLNHNIKNILNLDIIKDSIKKAKDHAYSDNFFINSHEIDFLQIGCKKINFTQ